MASTQTDRISNPTVNSSLAIKAACRAATTADINSSLTGGNLGSGGGGLITIDGVALNSGDRVLVKNQADQTTNGIWVATATAWQRDVDANSNTSWLKGTIVVITDGTASAGLWYELTTANPVTIGSSLIAFAVTSNPTVSSAMSPVVGAATLAQARTAMGVEAQSAKLDDIAAAAWAQGDVMYFDGTHLARLAAGTSGKALLTGGAGANPSWGGVPAIVGNARNLVGVKASNTTLTYTADEVAVEDSLGGTPSRVANVNLTLNAATTGAGGMDAGTQPTSGYLAVYLITKPGGANAALLGTITGSGSIYSGGLMPAGYTQSALIGLWPCGAGPAFAAGTQLDRELFYGSAVTIFNGTAGTAALASQSLSAAVPTAAKTVSGALGSKTTTSIFSGAVAASSGNVAAVAVYASNGSLVATPYGVSLAGLLTFRQLPLLTSQTIWWSDQNLNSDAMFVTGFTF